MTNPRWFKRTKKKCQLLWVKLNEIRISFWERERWWWWLRLWTADPCALEFKGKISCTLLLLRINNCEGIICIAEVFVLLYWKSKNKLWISKFSLAIILFVSGFYPYTYISFYDRHKIISSCIISSHILYGKSIIRLN